MEQTDEAILGLLARDGRMSYTDIGKATGLSTSAAQQRVRRLEQRGVITGYRAVLNPEALGKPLMAFIQLRTHNPAEEGSVAGKLAEMPEIVSCFSTAGRASYLLRVQVGTPLDLERLLAEIRLQTGASTETTLVLSVPFRERPLV